MLPYKTDNNYYAYYVRNTKTVFLLLSVWVFLILIG